MCKELGTAIGGRTVRTWSDETGVHHIKLAAEPPEPVIDVVFLDSRESNHYYHNYLRK